MDFRQLITEQATRIRAAFTEEDLLEGDIPEVIGESQAQIDMLASATRTVATAENTLGITHRTREAAGAVIHSAYVHGAIEDVRNTGRTALFAAPVSRKFVLLYHEGLAQQAASLKRQAE
jgi:hypothetical protein